MAIFRCTKPDETKQSKIRTRQEKNWLGQQHNSNLYKCANNWCCSIYIHGPIGEWQNKLEVNFSLSTWSGRAHESNFDNYNGAIILCIMFPQSASDATKRETERRRKKRNKIPSITQIYFMQNPEKRASRCKCTTHTHPSVHRDVLFNIDWLSDIRRHRPTMCSFQYLFLH